MLVQLSIKNFALIDDLSIQFQQGFTTITGETGAGKSILLGALSLVLGKRADLSSLKDKTSKCTVEAEFLLEEYGLESFFVENDLDYEAHTIVRRELLPSGKSRAFINDTPVTLDVLSALGEQLVDIHSQHQTLLLTENAFQFRVLDALAENNALLKEYRELLKKHRSLTRELQRMTATKMEAEKELDYNSFLLQELEQAPLREGVLAELEEEYTTLNNVEQLMELLGNSHQLLQDEQLGVLASLTQLKQVAQKLTDFGEQYETINERIQSVAIEVADVATDIERLSDTVEPNPTRLEEVNGQIQLLHDLLKKHQVSTIEGLIETRNSLQEQVQITSTADEAIAALEKEIQALEATLTTISNSLHKQRVAIIPKLKTDLKTLIGMLGMGAAEFKIEVVPTDSFLSNGSDQLIFQFAANKGSDFGELKKVASGGELSRIMLAIKSILASYEKLPTLIFDEIDTGVSGEISNKMGGIMKQMGAEMQLFSITHLPQVASQGQQQLKVYKEETAQSTATQIKQLTEAERIQELAEMLGGKSYADSAISHAKELLAQG